MDTPFWFFTDLFWTCHLLRYVCRGANSPFPLCVPVGGSPVTLMWTASVPLKSKFQWWIYFFQILFSKYLFQWVYKDKHFGLTLLTTVLSHWLQVPQNRFVGSCGSTEGRELVVSLHAWLQRQCRAVERTHGQQLGLLPAA